MNHSRVGLGHGPPNAAGLGVIRLERTATVANPIRASAARTPDGNSGTVELVVVEVLVVVVEVGVVEVVVVVELVVVVVVVVVVVDVVEVELAVGEYAKVTTFEAVAPPPPHVALME